MQVFETFECSSQNLFKLFKSVLKQQVNFFSRFASYFIFLTHNSSVNFQLINFILSTKVSHQIPNFETFKCSSENLSNFSCHFLNHKLVFLQILHHSSVSWKITPLFFFSWNNIYFSQKEPIKVKPFEPFECSGQNVSNSSWQFWNKKPVSLYILCHSSVLWKITPLYFFSLNNIYFAQKEPIKVKLFETFECLGQYLSNSSYQFWTNKSAPLQKFYHSSLSLHVTPI